MKSLIYTLLIVCIFCTTLSAQGDYNITLVGSYKFGGNLEYNDIWGYVDEESTEYAILGTQQGTAVISLADPANPVLVAHILGAQSIWRDMKSYGDYVYSIADQGTDGLLVIDMSDVSNNNVSWSFYKPNITINSSTNPLNRCHNMYIDENGILYLSGCTPIASGDVLMFDLNADPEAPPFLGHAGTIYSHDNYARGDTLYTSQINAGQLAVIDVSDKQNPIVLGTVATSLNFTHNAWLSDNGQYVFTTDEKANGKVDAYDITDVENMIRVDVFSPRDVDGQNVIPHNVHVLNDYLIVSWYTSGCVVVDATDPSNMVQVGAFDTWDGPNGGFNGAWGAYPFLPSGLILISDITDGLIVLQPEYKRAARVEGVVTHAITGQLINNANVKIVNNQINDVNTNFVGEYKSGTVEEGIFQIEFTHPEFEDYIVTREFINGDTLIVNAPLQPINLNVEFSEFALVKQSNGVSLGWKTETELDNEYFSIRRSVNGRDFVEIDTVEGGGTSLKTLNYSYLDKFPAIGLNYYLIKSNSYTGESKITPIRHINWVGETYFKVFPTIFDSKLTIQSDLPTYKIEILNLSGIKVFEENNLSEIQILNLSNLPAGYYSLRISGEFTLETFKIIKK